MMELVSLGVVCVAGVVWAVRLEGRVNVQDQKFIDIEKLINFRFDSLEKLIESKLKGKVNVIQS